MPAKVVAHNKDAKTLDFLLLLIINTPLYFLIIYLMTNVITKGYFLISTKACNRSEIVNCEFKTMLLLSAP